jgi:hypothetical protein
MAGGSYLGITQYLAAELQPPHLAAITPTMALSDIYREAYTHDGIPNFFFDAQYLGVQQPAGYSGPDEDPALFPDYISAKAGQVTGSASLAFGYLSRPNDDPWYHERSPIYNADRITVPVEIIDSWHDGFVFGANEMYQALSKRRGVETELFVDPCTHKGCGAPFDPETAPANLANQEAVVFEFLRKYLQPEAASPQRPQVRAYVQGTNKWLDTTDWPPPGSGLRSFYLAPTGLNDTVPAAGEQSYFTNPTAGLSMSFDDYGTIAASPYIPTDQRLEDEQGLTWRTPVVDQPVTLAGSGDLHLVAASSADNTDWIAKLSDVGPDGSEAIITSGMLRASYRELDASRSTPAVPHHLDADPKPLEPGKFYDFDVAIWPTAYELAKGHSLQLRLTTFDFPTHLPGTVTASLDDPSSTMFTPLPPATNTVRLGGADPSSLRMTVLGAGAPAQAVAGTHHAATTCRTRVSFKLPPRARSYRVWVGKRRVRATRDGRRVVVRVAARSRVRLVARTHSGRQVVERRRAAACSD